MGNTYIYICCGVIVCYSLGQVCFLQNTVCPKKHYKKEGFQHLKKMKTQIWGVIIWAKLAIFKLQQTWPR